MAPVFSADGQVEYYLPEGQWTCVWTGERRQGGRWFRELHDVFSLPLWVRPGHVLAIGSNDREVDYDYGRDLTLLIGHLQDGDRFEHPLIDARGAPAGVFRATGKPEGVLLERDNAGGTWSILSSTQGLAGVLADTVGEPLRWRDGHALCEVKR